MKCINVSEKYKNTKTTIIMTTLGLIFFSFLIFATSISEKVNKHVYVLLFLVFLTFVAMMYITYFDPTQLCSNITSNCRLKVALITTFYAIIYFPLNYFLLKRITNDKHNTICFLIAFAMFIINIAGACVKYFTKPETIINHKLNILDCQFNRILIYTIILAFNFYWGLQYFKIRLPPEQFAESYNLPGSWGHILIILYFFFSMLLPPILTSGALDGAIKYNITQINIT